MLNKQNFNNIIDKETNNKLNNSLRYHATKIPIKNILLKVSKGNLKRFLKLKIILILLILKPLR